MKSNYVDDVIASMPAIRHAGSGYIGGKAERESADWIPSFGPNAEDELGADFELLTARSRWLARNNELCAAAQEKLVHKTLGGNGIETWSQVETREGEVEEFNLDADDLIKWLYTDSNGCVDGHKNLHELIQTALFECIESGNGFLVERAMPGNRKLPLAFELIEIEQLDESKDRLPSSDQTGIFRGIEYNRYNRAVAYHTFNQWGDEEIIPAADVIHLYRSRRKALMGVTWFAKIVRRLWHFYGYLDAELSRAKSLSSFVAMIIRENPSHHLNSGFAGPENNSGTDVVDAYGNPITSLAKQILLQGSPGDDIKSISNNAPNGDSRPWLDMLLTLMGVGCGLSYQSFTGDLRQTSFSGGQIGRLQDAESIAPIQELVIRHVHYQVHKRLINQAIGFDRIRIPGMTHAGSMREFGRDPQVWTQMSAQPPVVGEVDEMKGITARVLKVKNGHSNFTIEMAKCGINRKQAWRKLERELEDLETNHPRVWEMLKSTMIGMPQDGGSDEDSITRGGSNDEAIFQQAFVNALATED